jgi:hypothetical protein
LFYQDIFTLIYSATIVIGLVLFFLSFKNSETSDKKWGLALQSILMIAAASLALFEHSFHDRLLYPNTWGHLPWYIALVFSVMFFFSTASFIRDTSKNIIWFVVALLFTGATVIVAENLLPFSMPKFKLGKYS